MPDLYCSRSDVFNVGVPRVSLTRPARQIESVDATASVLQQGGHGLKANDAVQFTTSGPGSLPGGLALITVYYALVIALADGSADENRFQVAAAPNGGAISLTTTGTPPFSLVVPTGPTIDSFIESFSRWVDSIIPADAAPLVAPIPAWIRNLVALRSAIATARSLGRAVGAEMSKQEDDTVKDAMRLAPGVPLRGDAQAQKPTMSAVIMSAAGGGLVKRGCLP